MSGSCDPEKRQRRSTRLRDYDYSRAGAYFITVCTKGRKSLFGEVKDGEVALNELGRIAEEEWRKSAQVRIEIDLDAWVVMPSHVHGIVIIADERRRGDRPVARVPTGSWLSQRAGFSGSSDHPAGLSAMYCRIRSNADSFRIMCS